jgi:Integrase core domain
VVFTKRCAKAGIEISMGSVGDCYDNAVCETFHASLKKERIYRQSWPTRAEARAAVFEYVEGWYNPRRRHSTLGYLSPAENERHHAERHQSRLHHRRRRRRQRLDPFRDGARCSNRSGSGRDEQWSRDERNWLASPLGSPGAGSLIQTSTTQGKTCRPNRGRSKSRVDR